MYDSEELALAAILDGTVVAGDVSSSGKRGPRGPRYAVDAQADRSDQGKGLGERRPIRWPVLGGSHGLCGPRVPEERGGPCPFGMATGQHRRRQGTTT